MSQTIAFDSHKFVKKLTAAGMPEAQAEILAEQQSYANAEQTATKGDIYVIQRDLKELEIRLTHNLTLRLGAMIIAATAFLAAIKFFG